MDFEAHTFSEKFVKLKNKKSNFLDINGYQAFAFLSFCVPGTEVTIFEMKYNVQNRTSKVTGRYLTKKIKAIEPFISNVQKARLVFE